MIRNTAMLLILAAALSASGMDGYTVPGLESQEVLISIHVWGEVAVPGTYLVPVSSDLIAGISAAGGPTRTASLADVRILYDDSEIVYDLDSFLKGEGDPVPELMPGATLYLRTRRYEWWKDAVDFTYKLIVTANIIWILFE